MRCQQAANVTALRPLSKQPLLKTKFAEGLTGDGDTVDLKHGRANREWVDGEVSGEVALRRSRNRSVIVRRENFLERDRDFRNEFVRLLG